MVQTHNSFLASGKFYHLLLSFANSLDPGQVRALRVELPFTLYSRHFETKDNFFIGFEGKPPPNR